MASKKRKAPSTGGGTVKPNDISSQKLRTIWRGIERNEWMTFLQQTHPQNKWSWTNDGIQGCCPFHDEDTPSFKVNFFRGQAKCFGCGAYFWNPVQFYAKVSGKSYVDALLDIKSNYNPTALPQRVVKHLTKLDRHRRVKNVIYHVTNMELIDAVALCHTDDQYSYAKAAVEYLARRGLPLVYENLPIGVMPSLCRLKERMTEYCQQVNEDVTMVTDALEYFDCYKDTTEWIGSLIFFYGTSPEQVSRLKYLQIPPAHTSSAFEDASAKKKKKTVFVPDDLEHEIGVFGLYGVPSYHCLLANKGHKSFMFVEGEFDALSLIANQCEQIRHDFIVLAASGGGHNGADLLHNFGFEECCIVQDHDKPGEQFVKGVLQKTYQVACRVFAWPESLESTDGDADTDPDKAVVQHGFEAVEAALCDPRNFLMPHKWALERADVAMAGIPEDNVRRLTATAAEWGLYVTNSAERHKYVADIAERHDIPAGPIWNEILSDDDSADAFVQRITDTLTRRFIVLGREFEGGRLCYECWHEKSEQLVYFPVGEAKLIRAALESAEGTDILTFVHNEVGEPGFEETAYADETDPVFLKRSDEYARYLVPAVARLGQYAPAPGEVKFVGTGCHAVKPAVDKPDSQFRLYLAKGTRLYKGTFPTEKGERAVWRTCSGPRDEDVYLYIKKHFRPRDMHVQYPDEDSLNAPSAYSLQDMYDIVRGIINVGWSFKKQDTTVDLLTALLLLIPIADVVERMPVLMFTGEQSSGKTSIVGGLIGRDALSSINIIQNSLFMANFTQAGVRQSMNHSSVCLCLDEFEDKGGNDRVSVRVRDVLTMVRGLANESAITRYGSASGKAQLSRLRFPLIAGGIYGLKDPADLSRFILIEMDRDLTRKSPETTIFETYGEDTLIKVRHELPRLMYHNAYQLYEAHDAIKKEFRDGKGLPEDINLTRTREMFYGLMAVMKLAGRDYRAFITQYFKDFRFMLERLSKVSVSNELFDELFYTPAISMPSTTNTGGLEPLSVNRIVREGRGDILNTKNQGVYYHEEFKWLVVHWPTAAPCILGRSRKFQDASATYLKQMASRGSYHLKDEAIKKSGILNTPDVKMSLGDTQLGHTSVYHLQAFVRDVAKSNKTPTTSVKGREVSDLTQHPRYKGRLETMQFPQPEEPPKKKAAEGGGSTEEPDETEDTDKKPGGVDDEFDY